MQVSGCFFFLFLFKNIFTYFSHYVEHTVKILKIGISKTVNIIFLKNETVWLHNAVKRPKDADELTNRVGPDQTAPLIEVYTICSDLFSSPEQSSGRVIVLIPASASAVAKC